MTQRPCSDLKLWPNHLKPLPDELASSWLVRLAHAHGYKSEQLCRILLGREKPMWNRDIDKELSDELRVSLKQVTAVTDLVLDEIGLIAYQGRLSEHVFANGITRWILPAGIWHRKRRIPGLMCCPLCLATDKIPYYRRSWRLSFVTVCCRHHVELIDECTDCHAPITPHRVDVGKAGFFPRKNVFVKCSSCGKDLRTVLPQRARPGLVALTDLLLRTLESGHVDWAGVRGMYSILFFNGLRSVIKVILAKELRSLPAAEDFERQPIAIRRCALTIASHVFDGSEKKLLEFATAVQARYVDFVDNSESCPFWLVNALISLQRSQHPKRSSAELHAIAKAVETRSGRATSTKARQEFGVSLSKAGCAELRSQVSQDAYESLLATIDHSIARADDSTERVALLQDKVMFSLIRTMGWGSSVLCRVRLSEVATLLPPSCGDYSDTLWFDPDPKIIDRPNVLLRWYLNEVRPRIPNSSDDERVFLNASSGRPMSESSIGARFSKAVRMAFLTASIRDMHALKLHQTRMPVRADPILTTRGCGRNLGLPESSSCIHTKTAFER
jgi:hypothetical protein